MLELIQQVAAEVITPRFRRLVRGEIMEKNPGDYVTVADREAEVLITDALLADDPDVLVVGEEATSSDPMLLNKLEDAQRAFVVDPVDGTKNFVNGRPDHAVMVAELHAGETVRAWVWQPEHRLAFVAERGAGLYRNGVRVARQAAPRDPSGLRVLTSRHAEEGAVGRLAVTASAWCCGVDYPWLAEGEADAIMYQATKPWDHAPGSLFVEETGGVVRYADGTRYIAGRAHPGRLVPAADDETWHAVVSEAAELLR